jgi:hypothetical protein
MAPDADPGSDANDSARLLAASRRLIERSRVSVQAAIASVDRARNTLQLIWLRRALQKRRKQD